MSHLTVSGLKVSAIICGIPNQFVDHLAIPKENIPHDLTAFVQHTGIRYQFKMPENAAIETGFFSLGKKVFEQLDWQAAEIDACVVVTQTLQQPLPALSNRLQYKLGFSLSCLSFDVNSGCSGFPYGLAIVGSLLKAQNKRRAKALLFIGDYSNQLIAPNDPSTEFLFSDVLAVIAIEYNAENAETFEFNLETDGSGAQAIFSEKISGQNYMRLNGLDVYQHSLELVPKHILATLSSSNVRPNNIILHQANQLINNGIAKQLQGRNLNFYNSIEQYGNSGSASIPLTLIHHINNFYGQDILCCGFGVGFSVSSVVFNLKNDTFAQLINLTYD